MQLDFWRSREGYTLGLEESSLTDIAPDEWSYLTQRTIETFNSSRAQGLQATDIVIGEHSIEVEVDSLPKLIGMMIDLGNEEIPEDYSDEDSIYRCLMLDLKEEEDE